MSERTVTVENSVVDSLSVWVTVDGFGVTVKPSSSVTTKMDVEVTSAEVKLVVSVSFSVTVLVV